MKLSPPEKKRHPFHGIFPCIVVGLLVLVVIVSIASYLNTKKYYLKGTDGALEIWQGDFSPTGKKRFLTLPGIQVPDSVKAVYEKEEVYPYAFRYYINTADAVLSVPGMPDFDGIKTYLEKANTFAVTDQDRLTVTHRLNHIDMMVLIYKADVTAGKGRLSDLETALDYLYEADKLDLESHHVTMIGERILSVKQAIAALREKPKR